jgi:hypothetical protein
MGATYKVVKTSPPSIKQVWRRAIDTYSKVNRIEALRERVDVEERKISNSLSLDVCGTKSQKDRIVKIAKQVALFPMGRKTLKDAAKTGLVIVPADGMGGYGSYCENKNLLCLNFKMNDEKLLATLAHESRHAAQFDTSFELNESKLSPKSYLMGLCVIEADASSRAAMVAFEMKQKGMPTAWNNFKETYPHLAKTLQENSSEADIKSGKAQTEVFKAWYDNFDNRRIYEKNYVSRINQTPNASFDKEFTPEELVKTICQNEDGKSYFKDNPKILEKAYFSSVEKDVWEDISIILKNRSNIEKSQTDKMLGDLNVRQVYSNDSNIVNRDNISVIKMMKNKTR